MRIAVALTIAGSDSGGGAGIQADIKTFHVLGVHGACAITSITSQNTRGVNARFDLPVDVVISQIEAVLDDFDVGSAKTGMLASADIIRAVAEVVRERRIPRLVVDPGCHLYQWTFATGRRGDRDHRGEVVPARRGDNPQPHRGLASPG